MKKFFVLMLVAVFLIGCDSQVEGPVDDDLNEETQAEIESEVEVETEDSVREPADLGFDDMMQFGEFVLSARASDEYLLADKPEGFDRVKWGGEGDGIEVTPDGVSANVYVLAETGFLDQTGNLEDVDTFYLEVYAPTRCLYETIGKEGDVDCGDLTETKWYGPFEGKVRQFVQ